MRNDLSRSFFFKFSIGMLIGLLSFACANEKQGPLFKLLSPSESGVTFSNDVEDTPEFNIINYQDFYSGGGISIGDINNDGFPDLFFTGNLVQNRLYLNKGKLKFEDITTSAGVIENDYNWCTGSTMVDINNDGLLDIYVCYSGLLGEDQRRNKLWVNQGDNTFKDEAGKYNLDHAGYSVNANFFDMDKDGDLDMYLVNQGPEKNKSSNSASSRKIFDEFSGDKLFRNDSGRFVDVTVKAGIYSALIGFGHGAAVGDLNNDGWDDIYVCNDFFEHDYLYLNNKDGTFAEVMKSSMKHISNFAMGNDMSDFNNDGFLDIVVVDMVAEDNRRQKSMLGGMNSMVFSNAIAQGYHYQYMYNTLQMNNGNMTFSEIGQLAGISYTDWSWGPLFADFDNDGFKDLFVPNGLKKDIRNIDWARENSESLGMMQMYGLFTDEQWEALLNSLPSEKIPNYMFRNGGQLSFAIVTGEWGLGEPSFSNGASYADLDNDGDQDLIVNNIDQPAFIYENLSNKEKTNYLQLKLKGPSTNTLALGTKVVLHYGNDKIQFQQLYLTRGYRSSVPPELHFGLGNDSTVNKIEIFWPDDTWTELSMVQTNQLLEINYSEVRRDALPVEAVSKRLFANDTVNQHIQIRHRNNLASPYQLQPLLPYKVSDLGPKMAVTNVNGDGLEDLFVGGAFGEQAHLLIQNELGEFKEVNVEFWLQEKEHEDAGLAFFDADADGDQDLYIVSGGYEFEAHHDANRDRLYLNDGRGNFTASQNLIPDLETHGGNVYPFDYDKDGDPDLLITGRVLQGKYPLPANSYLLQNNGGTFENVTETIAPELLELGLATAAVWSDYDLDGDPDFLIVGEWMDITAFVNRDNRFYKVTAANGLENTSGWWNCIEKFDFDQDGDDDFVAGNLGLNYRYKTSMEWPLQLFSADIDKDERQDIVLAYYEQGILYPLESRDRSILQIPELEDRIPTYTEFATSKLEDIYGITALNRSYKLEVNTFASSYIENLGGGNFKLRPLDNYVQISPINGIIVNDFNNDNQADLLVAGNLYSSEAQTARADAGIGAFMEGGGTGDFNYVPNNQCGLVINGDVKDIKLINTVNGKVIAIARNNGFLGLVKVQNDLP